MPSVASLSVISRMESLFDGNSVAGLSDSQLIERFTCRRDSGSEVAFAALVARHGPMVLGVCMQLLPNRHDAEDAFQAVFLVLARKAASIRDPDLLGNWLYGVAIRIARKAKRGLARLHGHRHDMWRPEAQPSLRSSVLGSEPIIAREQAEILHDEIGRLPIALQLPIVLCYFEGLTVQEAAARLHWPHGTVRSRLARARGKLRLGLIRRGVVVPTAAVSVSLIPQGTRASISSSLCDMTTKAALDFAAGRAAPPLAAALAREAIRVLLVHKLRSIALIVLAFIGGVTAASTWQYAVASKDEDGQTSGSGQSQGTRFAQPSIAKQPDPTTRPDPATPGRMTVSGRVLDADGKPCASAPIELIGRRRQPWISTSDPANYYMLLGRGVSDGQGRFCVEALRTSADRFFEVHALVAVTGLSLSWHTLNPDAEQPAAELRVRSEQVIHGKLVDVNGQPAAGVELRISGIGRRNTATGIYDGINMGNSQPPEGLRNWPAPVITDAQGRFRLRGVGPNVEVACQIRDERFAVQNIRLQTDTPNEVTLALQPATIVHGRVLAAGTGEPIGHAVVEVASSQNELGLMGGLKFRADNHGRYTANIAPGALYRVRAFPPDGAPYLIAKHDFAWTKGAVKMAVDVKVPRGVVIRGKVTGDGTAQSVAGASVQYISARRPDNVTQGWQAVVASKDDGTYQIAVPPGQGHLFIYGPTSDYVLQVIGGRTLANGKPGGERNYAHAIISYDVKAGDSPHEIVAALRPGKTVKGRVVGPEGQPVDHAKIISTLHFNYFHLNWRGDLTRQTSEGSFVLHGLDSEKATRVSFLDADHQWGATVELSGKQASDEVMIRLEPCGQAKARFVGPDGKPVVNIFPLFEILGTPGPHEESQDENELNMLAADAAYMPNVDRKHYGKGPFTDAAGCILLPDLIPGALYRISDTSSRPRNGPETRKQFTVKANETLDLGDILIEKPRGRN